MLKTMGQLKQKIKDTEHLIKYELAVLDGYDGAFIEDGHLDRASKENRDIHHKLLQEYQSKLNRLQRELKTREL